MRRDLRWAAGVLDAAGKFYPRARGGAVAEGIVRASVTREVAGELTRILGAGRVERPWHRRGVESARVSWALPAGDQITVLSLLVPLLCDPVKVEAAKALISFRVASPARGGRVSPAVREWRAGLAARVEAARDKALDKPPGDTVGSDVSRPAGDE